VIADEPLDSRAHEFGDAQWEFNAAASNDIAGTPGETAFDIDAPDNEATRSNALRADAPGDFDDDMVALEEVPGESASFTYERQPESPRLNWWRGLSFRRKHQQHPDDDNTWLDTRYAEPEEFPDDRGNTFEESWEDAWDSPANEAPYVAAAEPGLRQAPDFGPDQVTSEASWLEDVQAFPEPQPVAWHEERSRLLATRIPLEPLVLPDTGLGAVMAEPDEDHLPAPPVRDPAPYFAIDEPAGMDAFRSALFGSAPPMAARPSSPRKRVAAPDDYDDRLVETDPVRHIPATPRPTREARPAPEATHGFDPDFDIRDAVRDQDEVVERHFTVAANIAKTCSTCRSFVPDSDGRRGWCTNDWASTHRQMVNADELACRSSIGDWWLAADTTWIPPVDRIQPETPRTDRLNQHVEARADTSESRGRPVRTSKVV
jgi:hypothetical protein